MKILLWNIRLLGNGFPDATTNVHCASLADNLIAAIIWQYQVNVVVIQEVSQQAGYARMDSIRTILNSNPNGVVWSSDALPGAFIQNGNNLQNPLTNPPVNGDLGFSTTSHNEAYGVIWSGNSLAQANTAMSNGATSTDFMLNGRHFIDLVYKGFSTTPMQPGWPYVAAGNSTVLNFPIPKCADIVGDQYKDRNILQFFTSRRACVVQLNMGGGIVPCVTYHTPASSKANMYGAIVGFNSKDISAFQGKKWIYGGDFNLKDQGPQKGTLDRAKQFGGVIGSSVADDGTTRSSVVHYKDGNDWNGQYYRYASRDYAFMRNFGNGSEAYVLDPIADYANALINGQANVVANYLRAEGAKNINDDAVVKMIRSLNFGPTPMNYQGTNYDLGHIWPDIYGKINNDENPDPTNVWILSSFLYSYLISDHLPVFVEFY
jgi:hypothetical protein